MITLLHQSYTTKICHLYGHVDYRTNVKVLYYENNIRHMLFTNGEERWYKDGVLHRDGDEPALLYENGSKLWYKSGILHRWPGPAIVTKAGDTYYYITGKFIDLKVTKNEDLKYVRS